MRAKRSLSQNFLVDHNIRRKIVAELAAGPGDSVLEIGPGHGELSDLAVHEPEPAYSLLDPWWLASLAVLGLLVVIRTFLSWGLVVEIEGRWPWQGPGEVEEGRDEK